MALATAAGVPISVRALTKRFDTASGPLIALDGVDLDVAPGEFVSLLGPSGCGKSTLLRLVGGLLDPSGGRVQVGDEEPASARKAKHFGLVPQTPALLPWKTVLDNVTLLHRVNRAANAGRPQPDGLALLESVGLGRFARSLPRELSGGMQQRVALVRAFALGAPILLMDEPFAALDEITRSDVRYLLLDLWERTSPTVLFVTHSVAEAAVLSDRVVVMAARPGRIHAVEDVDLPRPRTPEHEDDPRFHALVSRLRSHLRAGSGR
jgi:NitT/TauT family transport system ATP-binding protein